MISVFCKHIVKRLLHSNECGLGLYGGFPSRGVCAKCKHATSVNKKAATENLNLILNISRLLKLLWRGCGKREMLLNDEQFAARKLYSILKKRKSENENSKIAKA